MPKRGRSGYITPIVHGIPNKGTKLEVVPKEGWSDYTTASFWGFSKRGQNQKWLHHLWLHHLGVLKVPKEGTVAT